MVNLKTTFHAASLADLRALDRGKHGAALVKTTPEKILELRQVFKDWKDRHELDFACIRSAESPDKLIQGAPCHLPYSLRAFMDDFARTYFAITRAQSLQIEIGRKRRLWHTHKFAALTFAINGQGTLFATSEGRTQAGEGDFAFMESGISHTSTDHLNDNRIVVAGYDIHSR